MIRCLEDFGKAAIHSVAARYSISNAGRAVVQV